MNNDNSVLHGLLVDESITITITELCQSCAIDAEIVSELVDEGILEPINLRSEPANGWSFAYSSLKRTRTVIRLKKDLGINLAGAALVIDLLERLDRLERQ